MKAGTIICAVCMLVLLACTQDKDTAASAPGNPPAPAATTSTTEHPNIPADTGPPPAFDANRAMQYVKEIVAFGPRPIGSENHKKVEDYLLSHLKGDEVENDVFTIETSEGKFPVHNIIAKFPGKRDGIIVIASHYDTNYWLRDINYVGANDGGSSSALLLEIANQLRGKPNDGYSVWLLWDDAEESMKAQWDDNESLYGVRRAAEKWQADGTLKKMQAFILEDMIGDADLNIDRDTDSTPWLQDFVYAAATRLGYQSFFFARTIPITDDHIPFVQRGVPSVDLIDLNYGYNNVFWHTAQDTADKLSPNSLQIVGQVTLETVRLLDKR